MVRAGTVLLESFPLNNISVISPRFIRAGNHCREGALVSIWTICLEIIRRKKLEDVRNNSFFCINVVWKEGPLMVVLYEGKCTVLLVKLWFLSSYQFYSFVQKFLRLISGIRREGEFSSVPSAFFPCIPGRWKFNNQTSKNTPALKEDVEELIGT